MNEGTKNILVKLLTASEREFYDYLRVQELEDTKMQEKISETIALTELVKSNREVFDLMTREFFKERDRLSKMAINSLDIAINCGDEEFANIVLNFLDTIYKEKYLKYNF